MKPNINLRPIMAGMAAWMLTLAGCASFQEKIPFVGEPARQRNEGYALLYELTDQEQNVDKILILKHAPPPVAAVIKEIAQLFGHAHDQLDQFAKQDASLQMDKTRLPALEEQTRGAISSQTTKRLIFSTGREFEIQLLLTQLQALQYASHLAQQVARQDRQADRGRFLKEFSQQCERLYQHVLQLLSAP